jgi:arylsulfatase A-like enzyme
VPDSRAKALRFAVWLLGVAAATHACISHAGGAPAAGAPAAGAPAAGAPDAETPAAETPVAGAADARPNFVVIVADDAALTDFAAYGGEAAMPNIDALAARGVRFTQYRTSPLCSPSRAMLLTGLDSHLTGVATIPEVLPREQQGKRGYSMELEPGVTTLATRLKAAGYRTLMTGKWHLGHGPGALPDAHGFDRSFALDASGADNWEQKPYMPYYQTADWFEDGKPKTLPDDFYSSEFLVDRLIEYLGDGADPVPFFAYLAFQAVHIPVQAPRELTDRYGDTYAGGWEALRAARSERARASGLAPAGAPLAEPPPGLRRWDTLTSTERALAARSMAVHAGMLEAMDQHIGRLVEHLRATGQLENTVFVVTSDNGPEPSDPAAARGMPTWLSLNGYSRDVATLGERGSYAFIGPEWAFATAAPSDLFKFTTGEGGVRAPLVVAGPGIAGSRSIDARSFVTDVAPTVLDYAGIAVDATDFTGRSLRPLLTGAATAAYGPQDTVGMEVSGNALLYKDRWKLVRNLPPWGDGRWSLFDLEADPGETRDLAVVEPARLAELQREYAAYAAAVGVLEMPAGYAMQRQIGANTVAAQIAHYRWGVLLGCALLLAAAIAASVALRRRRHTRRNA